MRERLGGLVLWAALFGLYATTLGIPAFAASDYGGDEPHYLLTAESIVSDGDVDLTDEYRSRAYADWYPYRLDHHGVATAGRLNEPHGIGFPLLIAPAYALGGPKLVEVFLAAVAALGFVLARALARRIVPDPWATRGVVLVAVSPPALAYAATVYPELTAGTLLVAATLLALRVRDDWRPQYALSGAALLAALPWLGTKFLVPAIPVAVALVAWTARRRRLSALIAAEVMLASLVVYATVNEQLYGGWTPYAADRPGETATDAAFPGGYLDRLPRLAALWVDREYGILRWAPVLGLAFFAGWLLWRSRREGLARALPARHEAELAALLALSVCAGQILVAAFGAPTMFGVWFPGRHLVAALPAAAALVAWGMRHTPRIGAALGLVTVLASGWLLVDLWTGHAGGWIGPASEAPWGPAVRVLPLYGVGSAWALVVAWAAAAGLAALVVFEWLRWSSSSSSGGKPARWRRSVSASGRSPGER